MITLLIVAVTAIISIICFQLPGLFNKFDFSPYNVYHKKEFYRFLSHMFVHADWLHLIINMLVFFSFGRYVERIFEGLESSNIIFSGTFFYVLLYFGGGVVASISTLYRHKENPDYASVGASGAVSAILFTSIFFGPLQKVYFYGVLPVPGIIFGIIYLVYSTYMGRSGRDNINHDAHLWGAIFGFIYPLLLKPSLINHFINSF